MLVLNEIQWAKDMIRKRSLGEKPFETLCRIAMYYFANDISVNDARSKMEDFVFLCDSRTSITKWNKIIDTAIQVAKRRVPVTKDAIYITNTELDKINSLEGAQLKRLAFTLLCVAKYYNISNNNTNGWINTKDSEIMKLANIKTSIKRQSDMYRKLKECGLVRFSHKVDNTSMQICFVSDGDNVISVKDFRNLGYQYMILSQNSSYFFCEHCGIATKANNPNKGRKQKYCNDCSVEIAIKQRVNSVTNIHNIDYIAQYL